MYVDVGAEEWLSQEGDQEIQALCSERKYMKLNNSDIHSMYLRRCEWCRAKLTARDQHRRECSSVCLHNEYITSSHTYMYRTDTCEILPADVAGI